MVSQSREDMIVGNIALVHSIAKRFVGRGAEYDDIFQAGCLGLIKAVDGFDEKMGYQFSTYAVPVIMGEIKRIFRDGGYVKVSRSLREKSIIVQSARERYCKRYDCEPKISELSEITGIKAEHLPEILNIINPPLSLDSDSKEGTLGYDIPYDESDEVFDKISIDFATSKLNDNERALIKYRYYEGKTQCETADLLGISQVQVSRKEKALLSKLREVLS